jgi:hypothetical protein
MMNYRWAALLTPYNTRYRGNDDLENRHALSQAPAAALLLCHTFRPRSIVMRCAANGQTAPVPPWVLVGGTRRRTTMKPSSWAPKRQEPIRQNQRITIISLAHL